MLSLCLVSLSVIANKGLATDNAGSRMPRGLNVRFDDGLLLKQTAHELTFQDDTLAGIFNFRSDRVGKICYNWFFA
jgi:hypothetical protein